MLKIDSRIELAYYQFSTTTFTQCYSHLHCSLSSLLGVTSQPPKLTITIGQIEAATRVMPKISNFDNQILEWHWFRFKFAGHGSQTPCRIN